MRRLADGFLSYRYWLLCGIVFILMIFRTDNSFWVGDFWEHSSVIRELATHPWAPQHPQLLIDAPHAFNTPYHLVLAWFSRLTGKSAVEVLAIAGLINLLLYFSGFYLFISTLDREKRRGLAFYGLLLTLLVWGMYAWNFSGFYQLYNLGFVIPFPSTFAMAISLWALWLNARRIETGREQLLLPIWLVAAFVLLTHSITFFFLAAGLAAFTWQSGRRAWGEILKVGGLLLLAFGLAAFWPYYPFLKLMLGESAVYHLSNRDLYQHLAVRTWPLWFGLPLLYLEFRRDWRRPLPWMFAALLAVYLLGWVSGAYSYGRVMSYLGILLQISMAGFLLKLENRLIERRPAAPGQPALFSLGVTAALLLVTLPTQLIPVIKTVAPEDGNHLEKYLFLAEYTGQYDVILTDLPTSMIVPTFGGKVVAYDRPLAFVTDSTQRKQDVLGFYDPQTSDAARWEILGKYQVKYILLEKKPEANWEAVRPLVAAYGDLIYRGKRFLLYQVTGR